MTAQMHIPFGSALVQIRYCSIATTEDSPAVDPVLVPSLNNSYTELNRLLQMTECTKQSCRRTFATETHTRRSKAEFCTKETWWCGSDRTGSHEVSACVALIAFLVGGVRRKQDRRGCTVSQRLKGIRERAVRLFLIDESGLRSADKR